MYGYSLPYFIVILFFPSPCVGLYWTLTCGRSCNKFFWLLRAAWEQHAAWFILLLNTWGAAQDTLRLWTTWSSESCPWPWQEFGTRWSFQPRPFYDSLKFFLGITSIENTGNNATSWYFNITCDLFIKYLLVKQDRFWYRKQYSWNVLGKMPQH